MTVLWIVLAAVAVLALLALFLLWPARPSAEKTAPFYGRNYAHRGLHSRDKSVPENSLTAFRLAAEAGLDLSGLTVGGFLLGNLLPVTLGNVLGGVGLGALLWYCYRPRS